MTVAAVVGPSQLHAAAFSVPSALFPVMGAKGLGVLPLPLCLNPHLSDTVLVGVQVALPSR